MNIRKLQLKDAERMLQWMHNKDVCKHMQANFSEKKIDDCINFINNSLEEQNNLHMAVVDENDTYMGTVSLKNIDQEAKMAEFAITMHFEAMGKGYSKYGMQAIIQKGFESLKLNSIIWCVSKENIRANKFYMKNGYILTDTVPDKYKELYPDWERMNWYCVKKEGLNDQK